MLYNAVRCCELAAAICGHRGRGGPRSCRRRWISGVSENQAEENRGADLPKEDAGPGFAGLHKAFCVRVDFTQDS